MNLLIPMCPVLFTDDVEPADPEDDEEEETTEVRFVPNDATILDAFYKAVQDCTLLHPDTSSDMSGEHLLLLQYGWRVNKE